VPFGKRMTCDTPRFPAGYFGLLTIWLITTGMHISDGYLSPFTSAVMFLLVRGGLQGLAIG